MADSVSTLTPLPQLPPADRPRDSRERSVGRDPSRSRKSPRHERPGEPDPAADEGKKGDEESGKGTRGRVLDITV
jgi:hypothetical protein